MKCVVFAYHDIGCEAIRALHTMGEEITAVFTHDEDPAENNWFGSVKKLALEMKLPVFTPENVNQPEWVEKIEGLSPDIIYSFYYRKMIGEPILGIPPKGALNLHGSLLPKYRGRAPVNWVLVHGEKETGLTLHYMVKKADAGDVVAQRKVLIQDDDTALTLYRKLLPWVKDILQETVPLLASGKAPRIPQDASQATYFGGRKPSDGKIDWASTARQIYNLVRAVTHPYPGAFTEFGGKKLLIWEARVAHHKGWAGEVLSADPLTVACGQGSLELVRVQPDGGPEEGGARWARQNRVKIATILGRPQ